MEDYRYISKFNDAISYTPIAMSFIILLSTIITFLGFGISNLLGPVQLEDIGTLIVRLALIPITIGLFPILGHNFFVNTALLGKRLDKEIGILIQIINSRNNYENIDKILLKFKLLLKLIRILERIRIYGNWLFTKDAQLTIAGETQHIIKFLYPVLTNLRSDLSIRLEEQKQTLESAKVEVGKTIHGTPELNQISELQKERLDK